MNRYQVSAVFLSILGVSQMAGDLAGSLTLRAIAASMGAAPAPKVFSAIRGLETYSTRFFVESDGRRTEVTPKIYSRLRGPYNRRNVYGAVLAYAPLIPAELRDPVMRSGLCGNAPLLRELGIEVNTERAAIVIVLEPLPGTSIGDLPTRFAVSCDSASLEGRPGR